MTVTTSLHAVLRRGDYLVLVDYGQEGIGIWSQHDAFQDALRELTDGHAVGPKAIVKLMALDVEEPAP